MALQLTLNALKAFCSVLECDHLPRKQEETAFVSHAAAIYSLSATAQEVQGQAVLLFVAYIIAITTKTQCIYRNIYCRL